MWILNWSFPFFLSFEILNIGLVYFLSYSRGSGRYLILADFKRRYVPLGKPVPELF